MNTITKSIASYRALLLALVASLLSLQSASAALVQWVGRSNDEWNETENWNLRTVPVAQDTAQFNGTSAYPSIQLDGDFSVGQLQFLGNDYRIIEGLQGSTLTVEDGTVLAGGSGNSIQNIAQAANGTWSIAENATFEVTGKISGSQVTKAGSGTLLLSGGTDSDPSSMTSLRSNDGSIVLDGSRIDLTSTNFSRTSGALLARGGDIILRNGADVRADTSNSAALAEDSTMTITGSGTSYTGDSLRSAENSGSTGAIVVTDGASATLDAIVAGSRGTGTLTVENGATVDTHLFEAGTGNTGIGHGLVTGTDSRMDVDYVDLGGTNGTVGNRGSIEVADGGVVDAALGTWFHTNSSSLTVNGGYYSTPQFVESDGVTASIAISDPTAGSALTIGVGNESMTFHGVISDASGGAGSLRKVGNGTLTLAGANTFTGGLEIAGGKVIISSISSDTNLGAPLSGSGPLEKSGIGTLVLTGDNSSYTGEINILGGSLSVENTSGSGTGSDRVNVFSTGILEGNGTVGGDIWLAESDSTVSPGGTAVETLRCLGDVDMGTGIYRCDLTGNLADRLEVYGGLELGGTLEFTSSSLTSDLYVIATYGILDNQSPTLLNVPAGYTFVTSLPAGYAAANGESPNSLALVRDAVAPVITLIGSDPLVVECGSGTYVDPGATATDNYDGDLTGSIAVDSSVVNPANPGLYTLSYQVTDSFGNTGTALRLVRVRDTIAPVITLYGTNPQTIECGGAYIVLGLGATAQDSCDGDLTGSIVIDSSGVDPSTPGSYLVTYNVADAAGNAAITVARTVEVVDTTAPVITLTGANPQTVEGGEAYIELGATAGDICDGDLTGSIVIDASAVDPSTPGNYPVTYDVTDAAGNAATVARTVNVVDTIAPVITLNGASTVNLVRGAAYTELGATVADVGDPGTVVVIGGDVVNTLTPGVYLVTYNATDASGNVASEVTRTVTVRDPYTDWVDSFFPGETDPAIIGFDADPNNDGVSNGLAFVTGTSPLVFEPEATGIMEQVQPNHIRATFQVNPDAAYLNPRIEISFNLETWLSPDSVPTGVSSLATASQGVFDSLIQVDRSIHPRFFFRQTYDDPTTP